MQVDREFAVPGSFEAWHSDEEKGKLSAVHFVRFAFPNEAVRAFRTAGVSLVLDHPPVRARAGVGEGPAGGAPRRPGTRRMSRARVWTTVVVAALATGSCGQDSPPAPAGGDAAARGRQVYLAQCVTCHNADPAKVGPVGPPVQGASPELLTAKLLHGGYPEHYRPKRDSKVMPARPDLAPSIPDLAAYLQ
jgi:mono/diheme cytochrome c family protein